MVASKRNFSKVLVAAVPVSLIIAVFASLAASGQSTPTPPESPAASSSASAKSETKTSIKTETQAGTSQAADTKVTVNGQQVPVPKSGTLHRVIQDSNGTTTLDVSVNNQNSGTDTSTTAVDNSVTVQMHSSSDSSGTVP